jgi:integrase
MRLSCRENPEEGGPNMPYDTLVVLVVRWFLRSHRRWSAAYIRRLAGVLDQRVDLFVRQEMISDGLGNSLLRALKENRPEPEKKKAKESKKKKGGYRKSVKPTELRRLINYFRRRDDHFSLWIAGYLQVASRIGWRPGEIVLLRRESRFLRARAEKDTNDRGLTDTCEVDIGGYPERLIAKLDQWVADIVKWEEMYGGLWNLRSVMNGRLATACKVLSIRRIATYTLRHFAIACMKKSGFTQREIAVLINHASTRTATEKYGKGRTGLKRAKKMLGVPKARLGLVRDTARSYSQRSKVLENTLR